MNEEIKHNDKNDSNENAKVEKKEIDLLDFITLFWKERKKIIYISGSITILTLIYALLATPWYTATVKIIPSEPNDNLLLRQYASIAALAGVNIPMGAASQHYFYPEIIRSNFLLDRILKQKFKTETSSDLMTIFQILDVEIDSTKENWEYKIFERLKKRLRKSIIKIEIDELTEMIVVNVELPNDPTFVAEVANYIIEQLDMYNRFYKKTKAKEQRIYIEKGIEKNLRNLKIAEKKLIDFEIQNKDISSPEKKLQLNGLQMEVDIFYSLVKELKKQLEIIKIEEIKQTPTLNILEKAIRPYDKTKPKRLIILILGMILSVLISLVYIISCNYWKKNKDDIKQKIKIIIS